MSPGWCSPRKAPPPSCPASCRRRVRVTDDPRRFRDVLLAERPRIVVCCQPPAIADDLGVVIAERRRRSGIRAVHLAPPGCRRGPARRACRRLRRRADDHHRRRRAGGPARLARGRARPRGRRPAHPARRRSASSWTSPRTSSAGRGRRSTCGRRSSACWRCLPPIRAAPTPGASCSTGSGAPATSAVRGRSTSMSAGCAPRSSRTPSADPPRHRPWCRLPAGRPRAGAIPLTARSQIEHGALTNAIDRGRTEGMSAAAPLIAAARSWRSQRDRNPPSKRIGALALAATVARRGLRRRGRHHRADHGAPTTAPTTAASASAPASMGAESPSAAPRDDAADRPDGRRDAPGRGRDLPDAAVHVLVRRRTTACTRTSRSTTSPSAPGAGSRGSPTRRSTSVPPTRR